MSLVLQVDGRSKPKLSVCGCGSLARHLEMQKSVYTHTCIHRAWNPSYSKSSPIRRVAGSWRRSGRASAPCTRSWKPWTFSNRGSRGTSASSTRQGSSACGRRGKSASTRCARSHSASWTNGCDNTAACGRPASTGLAPSSIDGRRREQENTGRHTHDKQPEDGEGQGGGRSDREGADVERDVRTRRSAIHGHGRRPVLHVRAGDFPFRELRHTRR